MQVPILRSTHKTLTERIGALKKDIEANSKEIGRAAALGDLKENSAYHSARERQVLLLERMQRLKVYLGGRIIDVTGNPPDKVSFGTSVTVVDSKTGTPRTYNIVGPAEYELALLTDIVTIAAPVARLLMGKKTGDTVEFKFGSTEWTGVITDIRAIE
jgi:transcription elongation factor GreA